MQSKAFLGTADEERVRWHFDFTGMSKYFFSLSGVILLIGAIAFATLQLNLGLDFASGSRITAGLTQDASVEDVRTSLEGAGVEDAEITEASSDELGDNVFQIEADIEPEQVRQVQPALDNDFTLVENGFDSTTVGPTFGEQVARSAIYAILFSLLVICAYMAFRFEPKYAVPVLIAVIHDILITGGVYALAEREVTSGTVAAFLTILGYSLYDCVIVFDRIRENVPRLPRATFSQIVNRSMSEVLTRSLITGLSSVFLVAVLFIFGGTTLQDFAFAMIVGIASGTYSSIFIAAPVLTAWKEREPAYRRRRERIEEQMGSVPPFPEENVIARLEGDAVPEAPAAATPAPEPPAPAPSRGEIAPAAPQVEAPPRPEPTPQPERTPTPEPEREPASDGEGSNIGEKPELSDASAAALERLRGGKDGKKKKRKHGRPR
jgi:SecD/SecF fusion protein